MYDLFFIFYYGLYPIDSDVSTFLHIIYESEQLARLATKLEIK